MSEVDLATLRRRFSKIPAMLRDELANASARQLGEVPGGICWDVVGLGASATPAQLFVDGLVRMNQIARYVEVSELLEKQGTSQSSSNRGLVIFSQGLSPNAQIAMDRSSGYARRVLFTAVDDADNEALQRFQGSVLIHGAPQESGSLLRLQGPLMASISALCWLRKFGEQHNITEPWFSTLQQVPAAYESASHADAVLGADPLACLAATGKDLPYARCLMWKWQEGLYTRLPASFDALGFSHGPFQSLYECSGCLFLLVRKESRIDAEMERRLRGILHNDRHRVVPIVAQLPGPLGFFEFDAKISSLLLDEMSRREIDPSRWPGQGADQDMYLFTGEVESSHG